MVLNWIIAQIRRAQLRYAGAALAVMVWLVSLWTATLRAESPPTKVNYEPSPALRTSNVFNIPMPPIEGLLLRIPKFDIKLPTERGDDTTEIAP